MRVPGKTPDRAKEEVVETMCELKVRHVEHHLDQLIRVAAEERAVIDMPSKNPDRAKVEAEVMRAEIKPVKDEEDKYRAIVDEVGVLGKHPARAKEGWPQTMWECRAKNRT